MAALKAWSFYYYYHYNHIKNIFSFLCRFLQHFEAISLITLYVHPIFLLLVFILSIHRYQIPSYFGLPLLSFPIVIFQILIISQHILPHVTLKMFLEMLNSLVLLPLLLLPFLGRQSHQRGKSFGLLVQFLSFGPSLLIISVTILHLLQTKLMLMVHWWQAVMKRRVLLLRQVYRVLFVGERQDAVFMIFIFLYVEKLHPTHQIVLLFDFLAWKYFTSASYWWIFFAHILGFVYFLTVWLHFLHPNKLVAF